MAKQSRPAPAPEHGARTKAIAARTPNWGAARDPSVADLVRTPLPEVRPELPLSDAVRVLRESGRQLVLVTTPAGMPVGALTVRDVTRAMAAAA